MKQFFAVAFAAAMGVGAAIGTAGADAKTLRWASQGDIATHDPHAQNESFNNQFNGQIYEQLLVRDKSMKPTAGCITMPPSIMPMLAMPETVPPRCVGTDSFAKSWNDLIACIGTKSDALTQNHPGGN